MTLPVLRAQFLLHAAGDFVGGVPNHIQLRLHFRCVLIVVRSLHIGEVKGIHAVRFIVPELGEGACEQRP